MTHDTLDTQGVTMVARDPQTTDEYIASLPDDRREAVRAVREVVRDNLPAGFEEGMQFGMIGWYVPLDMGKSCVRFRRLEDLPLDVIAETIRRVDLDSYAAGYEAARGSSRATRAARASGDPGGRVP